MITQSQLKKLLHYNPETGVFTWLERDNNKRFNALCAGNIVGAICPNGYLITSINNKSIRLHKLAFLYMEGRIPRYVDHKNRNKSDNSWDNLRECTASESAHNTGLKPNNKSGFKGVRWNKQCGKWQAVVKLDYKQHHVGLFATPKEAALAYDAKAIELHGCFAQTNKMMGLL